MFKRLICALGLLVTFACERPLYMGGPETQLLSNLENPGDMQFQGSLSNNDFQFTGQLAGEFAVARNFALRGHLIGGGDDWSTQTERYFGIIRGFGAGVGSFYTIVPTMLKGSTWLGVGEGLVRNEHGTNFSFSNRYSRYYLEQQLCFEVGILEAFVVSSIGQSHVYRFSQQGEPLVDANADWLQQQFQQPRAWYGSVGTGLSVGSPVLRLHGRIDWMYGPGRHQVTRLHPFFFSAGLSWRIPAMRSFR